MINKKIGKGRPPRQDKNHQEEIEAGNIDHWSCKPKLNKIVQILASQGQILFKCLSGYISAETQRNNSDQFSKPERQDFLRDLNIYQTSLLNMLGYTADKQFFFIGKNESNEQISHMNHQLQEYDLLSEFIDYGFLGTLRLILQYENKEVIEVILENSDDHRQLLDWAIIKARTKAGRELLTCIQRNTDPSNMINYRAKVEEWRSKQFGTLINEQNEVQRLEHVNDQMQQQMEGEKTNLRLTLIKENYEEIIQQLYLLLDELFEVIKS